MKDASELLKNYKFKIREKIKFFCPNCFKTYRQIRIIKHFGRCPDILMGRKILKERGLLISLIIDDPIFRTFLNKLNKFIYFYTDGVRNIPYSKEYKYFILQYHDLNFKMLLIGLAFIRFDNKLDRFVLSAIVIFPKNNKNKGYGKFFLKVISEYYKKYGGIIVESPNHIIKKICDKQNIPYYYHM